MIVAGLGRCGSSMVMQMLSRGGIPCVGRWPAFESAEAQAPTAEFIAASAGKAVKILDPQRVGLPGDVRVIWLDRDYGEQAKSHAKFLGALMGLHVDRDGRRKLVGSMMRDTHAALSQIGGRHVIRLRFEEALANPEATARLLGEYAQHPAFNVRAAAAAVHKRSPACATGMDIELALMKSIP